MTVGVVIAGLSPGAGGAATLVHRGKMTWLLSRSEHGGLPNAASCCGVVSHDERIGRVMAFESLANDITAGARRGVVNVYAVLRKAPWAENGSPWVPGRTVLVSRGLGGQPANGASFAPALGGDSANAPRCVAFLSRASNLVPGDRNRPDRRVRRGPADPADRPRLGRQCRTRGERHDLGGGRQRRLPAGRVRLRCRQPRPGPARDAPGLPPRPGREHNPRLRSRRCARRRRRRPDQPQPRRPGAGLRLGRRRPRRPHGRGGPGLGARAARIGQQSDPPRLGHAGRQQRERAVDPPEHRPRRPRDRLPVAGRRSPGRANGVSQIVRATITTGRPELGWVSQSAVAPGVGNGPSYDASITDGGEWILFDSTLSNFGYGGDLAPPGQRQVYRWTVPELATYADKTHLAPESVGGPDGDFLGRTPSEHPDTSARGNYVPFESDDTGLDQVLPATNEPPWYPGGAAEHNLDNWLVPYAGPLALPFAPQSALTSALPGSYGTPDGTPGDPAADPRRHQVYVRDVGTA